MPPIDKYFGTEGPWAEALRNYNAHVLPADVLDRAAELGDSRFAFCLGYAFGAVLKRRGMRVTRRELEDISFLKITHGDPTEFVKGYRLHATRF